MPRCPKCGRQLERIHRSALERAISHVFPMRRFRCKDSECGFEGCITDRVIVKKRVLQLLLPVIGILVLLVLRFVR